MSMIIPTEGAVNSAEGALAGQMAMNGVPFATGAVSEGSVYMGNSSKKDADNFEFAERDGSPIPDYLVKPGTYMSTELASAEFWKFTPEQDQQLSALIKADTGRAPTSIEAKKLYWENLVKLTSAYTAATGDKMESPWDMGARAVAQSSGGRGGAGGGGPSVTNFENENVNLSNPTTARRVMDDAIGQYLGRAPEAEEYNEFLKTLNGFEQDSPSMQKGVTRNSGGSSSTTKTEGVSSGGVDRSQVAKEFAMRDDQYQETTMETTGIQTFLDMLKG